MEGQGGKEEEKHKGSLAPKGVRIYTNSENPVARRRATRLETILPLSRDMARHEICFSCM
jgi:hypothetical protein